MRVGRLRLEQITKKYCAAPKKKRSLVVWDGGNNDMPFFCPTFCLSWPTLTDLGMN